MQLKPDYIKLDKNSRSTAHCLRHRDLLQFLPGLSLKTESVGGKEKAGTHGTPHVADLLYLLIRCTKVVASMLSVVCVSSAQLCNSISC